MTDVQRGIGVGGAVVLVALLLYPPWRAEYENGASLTTYSFVFSPPNDYRHLDGARSIPPRATSVAATMLLGELVAVAAVVGFLLWVYRPTGTASPTPITSPPNPAPPPVALNATAPNA